MESMPTHTHDRRMEVYLYFEMPEDALVFHYMGEPKTRHIVMRNEEAVIFQVPSIPVVVQSLHIYLGYGW